MTSDAVCGTAAGLDDMDLKRVDYDEHQHAVYARGRAMPDETKARWMRAFAEHLPPERPLPIVDLGSGIGRLTPALAEAFGGPAYGVEPSRKMREVAEATAAHPGVAYLAGEAAHIPLADDAAAAVVMFLSFHHVPDRAAGAVEIARVLGPGGRVLMVSGLSDRMEGRTWWHRFFPGAEAVERAMFPSLAELQAVFAPVGLTLIHHVQIETQMWPSVAEAAARLRLRPFSTFEHLSEDEIQAGIAALDAAAAAETSPQPVTGMSDLLVLG
jgi:ubiquinone/menaquinone biosynthesis C-methylase UbiE